jgi:hypothetical protein
MAPPFKLGAQDGVIRRPRALLHNQAKVVLRRRLKGHTNGGA